MEPSVAATLRLAAAFLGVGLISCGGSEGSSIPSPSPCISPIAAAAGRLPRSLPLQDWGTITEVTTRAGFLGAEMISETQIVELYPEIVRALTEAGYTLLGGDNEGFEAEMTFSNPQDRLTTLTLREGPCDEVIVRVLVKIGEERDGST